MVKTYKWNGRRNIMKRINEYNVKGRRQKMDRVSKLKWKRRSEGIKSYGRMNKKWWEHIGETKEDTLIKGVKENRLTRQFYKSDTVG